MSPTGGAALERLRLALLVPLVLVAGSVAMDLVAPVSSTTGAPAVVLLAGAAAAVLAVVASRGAPLTPLVGTRVLPARLAGHVPSIRAGHVTDSPRHPLRPRAPGLV